MNLRKGEFLALMAAATAVTAIAVDTMLPAFSAVRAHFALENPADTGKIVTVFLLGLGLGQLIYGPLADRFGRKPVIRVGLVAYMLAGVLATLAPTFSLLLWARFAWGLGSAGPRIIAQAMLRDRFSGDALSRALAVMFTIFLVVPTVAPLIGQLVLQAGSWRYTFAVGPVFALAVFIWLGRVEETLPVESRRSVAPAELRSAVTAVLRSRRSVASIIALTLLSGAFLPYLSGAERIFDLIYDRGDEFFFWFSLNAALLAAFTLGSSRVVRAIGSDRTVMRFLLAIVASGLVFYASTVFWDGVPPFAVFYILTTLNVGFNAAARPTLTQQALEDVGHVAGTASSLIGAMTLAVGSLIAQVIDSTIDATVTPFAFGFLAAASISVAITRLSRRPAKVAA